jgi:tetratricopeptide (TPR) repeat protein
MDYFLEVARRNPAFKADVRAYYLSQLVSFYEQLLADQDDPNPEARRLRSRACYGLGVCHMLAGNRQEAAANLCKAQAIQEELMADSGAAPDRAASAAELSVTLFELARLYRELGNANAAAAAERAFATLLDSFPEPWIGSLVAVKVAERFNQLGHYEEALVWQEKVIEWLEASLQARPADPHVRPVLRHILEIRAASLSQLGRHRDALKVWDRRLELDSAPLPVEQRVPRCLGLASEKDHVRATAEVDALETTPGLSSSDLYNLACAMSLSAGAVRQDKQLTPGERERRAEQYATRAMALLERSRMAGFFQVLGAREQFSKDVDWDPLRSRDDFRKFADAMERK